MKINEIIDTEIRSSKHTGSFENSHGYRPHPDEDYDRKVGKGGSYYGAYSKENNPHEVDKLTLDANVSGYPDEGYGKGMDAQSTYVMELIKRKITGNNIFAPRIYNYDELEDDEGYTHVSFTEETLLDARDVTVDEVKVILRQIFSPRGIKEVGKQTKEYSFNTDTLQERLTGGIGRVLEHMIHNDNIDTLSDDLDEVLELIKEIINTSGGNFWTDIHDENIMYRRTSTGVQLVISDPIS